MPLPPENLFTHAFDCAVWRIHPHPTRNEWVVELRDPTARTAQWALLDLDDRAVRWQTTPPAADWWSTLAGVVDDVVLLHNYRFPDLPQPTDLLGLDGPTGQLAWVLPGWLYDRPAGEADRLVVVRNQPEGLRYCRCDARLGVLLSPVAEGDLPPVRPPGHRPLVRYAPHDVHFGVLSSFLEKLAGVRRPAYIDYLEADPHIVFSYYLYEAEKTTQYLLVTDRSRRVLYHETLSEDRSGAGLDTVLWKNDYLVFLRSDRELTSIHLTD